MQPQIRFPARVALAARIISQPAFSEAPVDVEPSADHPLGRAGKQYFWEDPDEYVTHIASVSELLDRTKKMARSTVDHDTKTIELSRPAKSAIVHNIVSNISKAFLAVQNGNAQVPAPTTPASSTVLDIFNRHSICNELQVEVETCVRAHRIPIDLNEPIQVLTLRQKALKNQLRQHRVLNTLFATVLQRIIGGRQRNGIELLQGHADGIFGEPVALVLEYESAIQAVCGGYATMRSSFNYHDS